MRQVRVPVAVLSASVAWIFFDQAKHNPALSGSAGFLDDPYDAIGSFAIQFAAISALAAVFWRVAEWRTGERGLPGRGSLTAAICCALIGIADLIGQAIGPGRSAGNGWVWAGIVGLIVLGLAGVVANLSRESTRLPSLLGLAGAGPAPWRSVFARIDDHPIAAGLSVGLLSGVALAISHQVLEGGPETLVDLLVLSAILILGEGIPVAAAWLVLGQWLGIHSGFRLRRAINDEGRR
jgi:hypothetical protein